MNKIILAKNVHKIQVKQKDPNKLNTGANTQIYLDGQELYGATLFKFEVSANGVGKVTIEMLASVELDESTIQDVDIKVNNL